MIRFDNQLQMLRALKGAPLSVYLAIVFARSSGITPVGQEWIERATGYTDKPVSQALELLKDYGLVQRNQGRGWALTGAAVQLPLTAEMLPVETDDAPGSSPAVTNDEMSRKNSDSLASGINQIQDSDQNLESSQELETENLRVCDEEGIREPAKSRIARQKGVTPEAIRYHCKHAQSTGQAIYRIEHGWRLPADMQAREVAEPGSRNQVPLEELIEIPEDPGQAEQLEKALAEIAGQYSRVEFNTWLTYARPAGIEEGVFLVRMGNRFSANWAEAHNAGIYLERQLGRPVKFVV